MALTHVADTSVLTRLHLEPIREVVEPLVSSGRVARTSMSDLEVGFSARNAREWDSLYGALTVFRLLEIESRHFVRARQMQRALAARRQRGRKIPDLLIAAAAEGADLVLLHYDSDFDQIARATGQTCEWVVSPGSAP